MIERRVIKLLSNQEINAQPKPTWMKLTFWSNKCGQCYSSLKTCNETYQFTHQILASLNLNTTKQTCRSIAF